MRYKVFSFFIAIIAQLGCLHAQERFSKEELLQLIKEKKYQIAYPILETNLIKYPKDIDYIYATGVCRVQLSTRINEAIQLLLTAVKQSSINDRWFYLGKAYLLNYQFAEAEDAFNKFDEIASKPEKEDVQYQVYLSMLKNAREMYAQEKNLSIVKTDTIAEENLLSYLNKQKINGHFEPFIWNNREGIQFTANSKGLSFQSRYSSRKKNVNIFSSQDKAEKMKLLGNTINTALDEMFIYYDDSNSALYFSSQGHNSTGGYDIFRSYYDEKTKEWTTPENLGFPINTPFDELAFIPVSGTNQSLLATKRGTNVGKIVVYTLENSGNSTNEVQAPSNIKETNQLKPKNSQLLLVSPADEKPTAKHSNNLPLEIKSEQYQKLLQEALTLQMKSDSVRKLSDRKKEQFIVSKSECDKASLMEQIKIFDKKAEDIQLKADVFYRKLREIETHKIVNTPHKPLGSKGENLATSKYTSDTMTADKFDIYYRIQVGIFSNAPSEKLFNGFTNIYKEPVKEGIVKYYIGKYLKATDAEKCLVKVKDAGFKDAYIIGFYNNRIIPYVRAKELEKK